MITYYAKKGTVEMIFFPGHSITTKPCPTKWGLGVVYMDQIKL